jgi:histidinol-phosphate aminotransferase
MIKPELQKMKGYVPLDPVDVLGKQAGRGAAEVVKLDGNENPYGCSPRARRAISRFPYYNYYPDPEQRELRKLLAGYTGVPAERVVMGAGSDELIDNILRLFIKSGDRVINCPPTFGMYQFSTDVCGGRVIAVPRKKDFSADITAIKKAVDRKTRVIFIASPNNPTGNVMPERDVLALVGTGLQVVIDEAYYEFSGRTVARLVGTYPNLMVLRTFSKWAGLAGLRVGYGMFPEDIAAAIMKIKQPYNINAAAQAAATASLKDLDYIQGTIKAIIIERGRLMRKLKSLKWLEPYPSEANFILCRVGPEAKAIWQYLKGKGIFIRYFDNPVLKDYIRISIGKPEHTDRVIEALRGYRRHP